MLPFIWFDGGNEQPSYIRRILENIYKSIPLQGGIDYRKENVYEISIIKKSIIQNSFLQKHYAKSIYEYF